jgi:hypothetical protein
MFLHEDGFSVTCTSTCTASIISEEEVTEAIFMEENVTKAVFLEKQVAFTGGTYLC